MEGRLLDGVGMGLASCYKLASGRQTVPVQSGSDLQILGTPFPVALVPAFTTKAEHGKKDTKKSSSMSHDA